MSAPPPSHNPARVRVLIAGGGVAGLETLVALPALAGDRLAITILAPELKFVNLSMAVEQPFKVRRGRGLRLEETAAELGTLGHRGALDRVEHDQHRVVTKDRDELPYDRLVLALGARPEREWRSEGVLTYHGGRDGPNYRLLLDRLREGRIDKLALITPEDEPLGIFGHPASAAIRQLLDESGVTLHTSGYGVPHPPGRLDVSPGDRSLAVDRIVTVPRLVGPRLRGIPSGRDGFIHTDAHGRVPDLDGLFAAGDATTFPVKQGGLAAQQADAVAEAIAASAGAEIDPQPFRPILRGTLLTAGPARNLRADISGVAGDDSIVSGEALWWPPNKLCGRYLAPYLSSQLGEASDVMPQSEHAIHVETALDRVTPEPPETFGELSDIPPR